jgi:restriction system protein
MRRRRRDTDWEGIIRAGAALIILLAMAGGLNGGLAFVKSGVSALVFLAFAAIAVAALIFIVVLVLKASGSGFKKPTAIFSRQTVSCVTETAPPPNIEEALDALDWFQLEQLVARLFEIKGCAVLPRGGAKADGGIDLVVQTESTMAAVQCKHWGKWKCGPAVVRELIGSMVHENLPQGFLICRTATEEAKSLAASHRIRIIERAGLIDRIEDAVAQSDNSVINALFHPPKLCPKCGADMVLRTASKGRNPGEEFWGCSTYPKCHQVLKI